MFLFFYFLYYFIPQLLHLPFFFVLFHNYLWIYLTILFECSLGEEMFIQLSISFSAFSNALRIKQRNKYLHNIVK